MPNMDFFEALRVGLRSDSRTDRNAQRLVEMQGLIPTEWGAKALPTFTYPISSPTLASLLAWPHPQLVGLDNLVLLMGATAIYTVTESTWATAEITFYDPRIPANSKVIVAGGGIWQTAGFQGSWFATDGQSLLYKMPSNAGQKAFNADVGLSIQAVANHQNRLVFGGIAGTYFITNSDWDALFDLWRENVQDNIVVTDQDVLDTSYIFYSEQSGGDTDIPFAALMAVIGEPLSTVFDKFKPIIYGLMEKGRMGFHPIQNNGTIYALKEHNGDLIVYGDKSVLRLSMGEVSANGKLRLGYREQILLDQGIAGRGAVNGDESEHVFVTNQGEVYRLRAGEGLERLGYDEFVGALTIADIVVAYDQKEHYYFFSDGTNGFCLTRTGLGGCDDIMPISLFRSPGNDGVIGTGIIAGSPTGAVIETEIFDGGMRSVWEIAYVDISTTDTDSTGWQLVPKYRLDKSLAMTTKAAETFDLRGRVRTKTPGIDHAVRLTASNRTLVDLERILVQEGLGKLSLRDLHNTV